MNFITSKTCRGLLAGLTATACVAVAVPASAQDAGGEARLRKIESEVRALQRKVFPGGDGRYFEPQITGTGTATSTGGQAPSTTAVTDILARLDALEAQIASVTARTEENTNAVTQLSNRLSALESASGIATPSATSTVAPTPTPTPTPVPTAAVATPTPAATVAPAVSAPSAARLAAVSEIAKPQTDDAADDEYSYGYRLWNAGFYPEAQQQLTLFVEKYPDHWRTTYARNLLGRAYLDDSKPREAAPWFLKNYQADKNAARAPDSLLYLAESMIALGDTSRACIALAEFAETYTAIASGRLSGQYQADLGKVKCN